MKLSIISLAVLTGIVSANLLKRSEKPYTSSSNVTQSTLFADQFSDDVLSLHNSNRVHYGASALSYDNNLASGAASYAGQCNWGHSFSGGNYGENLFASGGSGGIIQGAVGLWMDEASRYDYNNPGFSEATGHFTQVVWKSTTTLGCGTHVCNTGSPFGLGDWTYTVCRYTPAGNVIGQFEMLAALSRNPSSSTYNENGMYFA
ncbi:Cell wall protein PRY3 [Leucoagaricus sp. SymC.cos]|nr:Cell wall protein PRY3 [Leucoagaricus sp. SymC.cos]